MEFLVKDYPQYLAIPGNADSLLDCIKLCINNDTLKMLMSLGVKWTIADEGILAKTLKKGVKKRESNAVEYKSDKRNFVPVQQPVSNPPACLRGKRQTVHRQA